MDKTQKLIKALTPKVEVRTPIATDMFLPNHSGDHSAGIVNSTPTADNDIVNKAYVDAHAGVTDHTALSNIGTNTHAQIDDFISDINSAWTQFTPAWYGITVGNATNVGRFIKIGKTVFFKIYFELGNTSSVTGNIILDYPNSGDLPIPKSISYLTNCPIGNVNLIDGSTLYAGYFLRSGYPKAFNTSATYTKNVTCTATVPFTWGTVDKLIISGFYEVD